MGPKEMSQLIESCVYS